jgi:hypothetical protein
MDRPKVSVVIAPTRPIFSKLRQAAYDARELADRLFRSEVTGSCAEQRCLSREEKRLAGHPTLADGATRRGFAHYDPWRLCQSCRPYWHAELAAHALETLVVREQQIACEEGHELEVTLSADRLADLIGDPLIAEVLIDPAKYPEEVRARAREVATERLQQHRTARDHHANVAALLDAVVRR